MSLDAPAWLPMGSAQLIDWKHLGKPSSARGATAWMARIAQEPVLVRSWCNENTTFYEFFFVAHEALTGTVVISTHRPEAPRLHVKVNVEVEGRLSYNETTELAEHGRTGLYGVTTRTMEGAHTPDALETLTAAHAEIFEYAPESALSTACGSWVRDLLAWVFDVASQAADGPIEPEARRAPRPEPAREVRPQPRPEPVRESRPEPVRPSPARSPEPEPAPSEPAALIATAATGERWEVVDDETYMGRSKQCSIVLKSQRVSRKHASITREDGAFFINDLGAANGIWAGTEKVERERIEDGAEYIIGDVLVTFTFE